MFKSATKIYLQTVGSHSKKIIDWISCIWIWHGIIFFLREPAAQKSAILIGSAKQILPPRTACPLIPAQNGLSKGIAWHAEKKLEKLIHFHHAEKPLG